MALKKLSRTGIVHTPLHDTPGRKLTTLAPIPTEVRDIDSIFGRLTRITHNSRMFVLQNLIKMVAVESTN
jgi:hypothetical protein